MRTLKERRSDFDNLWDNPRCKPGAIMYKVYCLGRESQITTWVVQSKPYFEFNMTWIQVLEFRLGREEKRVVALRHTGILSDEDDKHRIFDKIEDAEDHLNTILEE
jgi:hypothetical protein